MASFTLLNLTDNLKNEIKCVMDACTSLLLTLLQVYHVVVFLSRCLSQYPHLSIYWTRQVGILSMGTFTSLRGFTQTISHSKRTQKHAFVREVICKSQQDSSVITWEQQESKMLNHTSGILLPSQSWRLHYIFSHYMHTPYNNQIYTKYIYR